jgi:hypothetical protein
MFFFRFSLFYFGNLFLVSVFTSNLYGIYFFSLIFFIGGLYKKKWTLSAKELLYFLLLFTLISLIYNFIEDNIYDLFIDLGVDMIFIHINLGILLALTFIHLFILYLLGYNRAKII